MPKGMSFCGLRASEAAVETVSNPKYAKKRIEAARSTPCQPYAKPPSFGGTSGCQLCGSMAPAPTATNVASTNVLTTTRMLLTNADSETPSTSTTPITAVAATATTLAPPVTSQVPERAATSIVGLTRDGGMTTPRPCRRLAKYPEKPTARVEPASPYSSMSRHPSTQAKTSPSAA